MDYPKAQKLRSSLNMEQLEQPRESMMGAADDVGEIIHHGEERMEIQGESASAIETEETEEAVEDYLNETSDESSESESEGESLSTIAKLRNWAVNHNPTYESIEEVMDIIRDVSNCKLPKDARTLMKTEGNPSKEIVKVEEGQYWHHGVHKSLLAELRYLTE
ncbi:AGAP002950-PA-like protein [Anopheles sinensis]|uniref:AGAP002950-PA-like protein n=1 Tax=Anopheles sinensis TaxID=74873 RepID=A0A084W420_ANOSI|nr:AGAP002950-PA-like protein [Anopheles sinensis]